ncbi:MAG: hypothetical protein IKK48_03680 [Firmicutes bacterium]|nr:hypothetical protein [Bacillota bacterium]
MSYIIPFLPLATLLTLALITRKMAESMIAATAVGLVLLHKTNIVQGTLDSFYETFANTSFHFCVLIVFCFGIVVKLFQESGGLLGFAEFMKRFIKGRRSTLLLSWLISVALFVDEYLNALTVGFSMSKIADSHLIPREHLAMQVHMMACSLCIAVPLTSWTAFTISITEQYDIGLTEYIKAVPMMVFPLMSIVLCLLLALGTFPKVGNLKKAYQRVDNGGQTYVLEGDEKPLVDFGKPDENNITSPLNLFLPLICVIGGTLYFDKDLAIGLTLAIVCQFFVYVIPKKMSVSRFFDCFFEGAGSMLMINIIIFFGFTLSSLNEQLGLFDMVISLVGSTLPAAFVPVLVFLIVGFCVFASGSCWIIMLITMPIFLPLAAAMGAPLLLTLSALMSGVGAGYTLCFYADAVFLTTASTGVANLTIIKTIMPYAVVMTAISAGFYLVMGILM